MRGRRHHPGARAAGRAGGRQREGEHWQPAARRASAGANAREQSCEVRQGAHSLRGGVLERLPDCRTGHAPIDPPSSGNDQTESHRRLSPNAMKPKDLLVLRLREHVVAPLVTSGFRFAASTPQFSRTVGDVRQRIVVCANRYNREDDVEFWTMWSVTSAAYPRWYSETWGEPGTNDLLADTADWNLPGWSRGPAAKRFHLANTAQDVDEMTEFRDNVLGAGLSWLDHVSTWEGAAEARRAQRSSFAPAADFFMIADQPAKARATLLEGIDHYTRQPRADFLNELPRLRERLARYFPDATADGE